MTVLERWRIYGVPRCSGVRTNGMGRITFCRRLLWPWLDIGGNGESAMCRDCTDHFLARIDEIEEEHGKWVYP